MRIESATKGMEELNNESPVNKMGKYSFRNTKKRHDMTLENPGLVTTVDKQSRKKEVLN